VCIFVREVSADGNCARISFALKNTSAKSSFLAICLTLWAAIELSALPAFAQAAQNLPPQQALQTKTELVKLDVTVLDQQGNFVDGLAEQDFRAFDNGTERPIVYFAPITDAAKVVVVLETSPSVFLLKDQHLAAAYALMDGLGADDQVALITYSDVPQAVVPFTTNKMELLNALANVQYRVGSAALNLYYTVSDVIDGLARFSGKKAIVLLTTGLDSSPPSEWTTLMKKLRGSDVVIFSVGLLGPMTNTAAENDKQSKKISGAAPFASDNLQQNPMLARADQALIDLSSMTGGQAYFPPTGPDFAPAYRQISACLRNEYVIGISPEHDGQFHQLSVTVAAPDSAPLGRNKHKKKKHGETEYRVSFRQGYIAPAP
jgi:VWFA-related protein